MFGLGGSRGEGKPFLEVIRNADLHEIFRAVHAGGVGVALRQEIAMSSPAQRILGVNAVGLAPVGAEAGVVMVLHDVTALRQLERVRTEFVANVSHELRTPLTAIQGYLETLLSGALEEPENARRFLEIVLRHSERLGRLLNDLTDLSNIELGKVTLRKESVHLDELVASVVAIIGPRAARSRVTVTANTPPEVPAVAADRDRLVQILINLVDNAVKYTPEGGTVTVITRSGGDGAVEIAVADSGIGIPAADLPRITERFYRVDKARSRELGGTGLGLAIVKHLVLAHGGELRIESQEQQGTTVRFTLPSQPPV
jgi:two-component system phosphate regulon sensor histidine kinase PhoR